MNLTVPDRPTSIKRIYTDYDFDIAISNQANPVGLANFTKLWSDPLFLAALRNNGLMLLVVPLAVYMRGLRHGDATARHNAALGFAYGACIFVASFSTEVVDLKYTASLYALMTAVLCGGALARHGQD